MSNKWYADGLKFTCKNCGGCCTGEEAYVWVDNAEITAAAMAKKLSFDDFCKKYLRKIENRLAFIDQPNGDCIFLTDERRCEIYASRPQQCRTFPWWKELLVSKNVWNKNPYRCPGINVGENHAAEKIDKNAYSN